MLELSRLMPTVSTSVPFSQAIDVTSAPGAVLHLSTSSSPDVRTKGVWLGVMLRARAVGGSAAEDNAQRECVLKNNIIPMPCPALTPWCVSDSISESSVFESHWDGDHWLLHIKVSLYTFIIIITPILFTLLVEIIICNTHV